MLFSPLSPLKIRHCYINNSIIMHVGNQQRLTKMTTICCKQIHDGVKSMRSSGPEVLDQWYSKGRKVLLLPLEFYFRCSSWFTFSASGEMSYSLKSVIFASLSSRRRPNFTRLAGKIPVCVCLCIYVAGSTQDYVKYEY